MRLIPVQLLLLLAFGSSLGAQTTFELDSASYTAGDNIVASWTGGPGNSTDWVGLYPRGEVPDGNPASSDWLYVNGTRNATVPVVDGSVSFDSAGIGVGQWTAHFLANDVYTPITAGIDFDVVSGGGGGEAELVADRIRRVHGIAGQSYAGKLGAYARTSAGGAVTFSKASGPAWLEIAGDGTLSGTPSLADEGMNAFVVAVSDTLSATLFIEVFRAGSENIRRLKVLSFNIWVGATRVSDGYNKALDSIILSDADIVAISENNGRAAQLAGDLGWHVYHSGSDNAVLSRYELTSDFTASSAVGATVQIASTPLRDVHFWACHLTAYPYGPYDARDASGDKVQAALASETNSGRVAQINSILGAAGAQLDNADSTTPVLLLGDFNCPSHLDWTQASADAGKHFGLVVDWPVTLATEAAGMVDAFRLANPDPVALPGDTWTPIDPGDVQDRIDMTHYKGAALGVLTSEVFTTIDIGRWPSDHAGVLTEFALAPVDADTDGLADAWENRHFGNTAAQGSSGDPDGDGLTNFTEQAFVTDPNDGASIPISLDRDADAITLAFRRLADAGINYEIETSTDMHSWQPAREDILTPSAPVDSGAGVEQITYQLVTPAATQRYFRVKVN